MNKLNIGVVGAGRWGPNLIRNFHSQQQCRVTSVADTLPSRLKLIQERYSDIFITESADEIITSQNVDAVVICTPTSTHFEMTQKALLNKKHVFVEKPLASTPAECKTLIELARQMDRVLFVGHIFVYNAGIQAARRIIQSGELGKILYIHMTRTNLGPIRTDVSALWDLAPHDLSILRYWLDQNPISVSAMGGRYLNPTIEDVVFATYRYPDQMIANLHVSWLNPKKVREIVVVGEKKMLVWDDMDLNHPLRIYDKKVTVDYEKDTLIDTFINFRANIHEGDTVFPRVLLNEPLAAECVAFLNAIQEPSKSISSGAEGLAVVEALAAADASIRANGKEIAIQS